MGYTPNNDSVYLRAFIGAMSGMTCSGKYPTATSASAYTLLAEMADAWAQEVDTIWGVTVPTNFELESIQTASEAMWENRSTLPTAAVGTAGSNVNVATVPANYLQAAEALVALVQQANAQVVAEGVDPNGTGGGSGGGGSAGALGVVRFIDPANSTGFASDLNTGATANNVPAGTGPILTTAHLNALINNKFMTADTTLTYLSDDNSGTLLDLTHLDTSGFALTIQQTRQVLHTGGTINAGTTAINPTAAGGGQRQTAHTTDIADFAAFTPVPAGGTAANGARIRDTVTGAGAWIMKGAGTATASCVRPVTDAGAAGALTSGDAYVIERGGILALLGAAPSGGGTFTFNDCAFTASSTFANSQLATYNRCSAAGIFNGSGGWNDGLFLAGVFFAGSTFVVAGGWYSFAGISQAGIAFISGDTYIAPGTANDTFTLGPTNMQVVDIDKGIGTGVQLQDFTGAALVVEGANTAFVNGLIWGNGNGTGVLLTPGSTLVVGKTAGTDVPSITGTNDYAFVDVDGSHSTNARSWDETNNTYSTQRTCTWAHFVASLVGGGFNFNAHWVATNAHLVAPTV